MRRRGGPFPTEVPTVRDGFSETACGLLGCSAPPTPRSTPPPALREMEV
jgi:hypothetical protein